MRQYTILSLLSAVLLVAVCGGCTSLPAVGHEGEECFDDATCYGDLRCVANICVPCTCDIMNDCCDGCFPINEGGPCEGGEGICRKGFCSNCVNKPNGTACDDGNPCTQTDSCQNDECTGSNPVICVAMDQCHEVGECSTVTGMCSNPRKENGTSCNDANPCTEVDICLGGDCVGGNPKQCPPLDQCHNIGQCVPETGQCEYPNRPNGTMCDDGQFCSQGDLCHEGECIGGIERNCFGPVVPDNPYCQEPFCNEDTDQCELRPFNENGACDDFQFCTVDEVCRSGECVGTRPRNCNGEVPLDDPQCQAAACNEEDDRCEAVPANDGAGCDDGLYCTTSGSTCLQGICQGGTPRNCSGEVQLANPYCQEPWCNEAADTCVVVSAHEGDSCDDGNFCTVGAMFCRSGTCVGGQERNCEGAVTLLWPECQKPACDEETNACVIEAKNGGGACDDGNYCSLNDYCRDGICVGGEERDCSDAIEPGNEDCQVPWCNEATDTCSVQNGNEGGACNDDKFCKVGAKHCHQGECVGGATRDCSHEVTISEPECQAAICDEENDICRLESVNENGDCTDDLFCTDGQQNCRSGVCVGGRPRNCDLEVHITEPQCQSGVCNEEKDKCEWVLDNEEGPCDDGRWCTINDICVQGYCAGMDRDCGMAVNPPVPDCQDGACDENRDICTIVSAREGYLCDAGFGDNTGECSSGVCLPVDRTFPMGSPVDPAELGRSPGEYQHVVTLTREFDMDTHEVTQGEFTNVMGYNPSYFGPNGPGTNCGDSCPVENVSWYDAVAYANKRSEYLGMQVCYTIRMARCEDGTYVGNDFMSCYNSTRKGIDSAVVQHNGFDMIYDCSGWRLPTEAEWEYGVRAESRTAFYPSPGNNGEITETGCALDPNLDQIAWYCYNSAYRTHVVGGKEPNEWGMYDMLGNVHEWVNDWFGIYPPPGYYSLRDPEGPASGYRKVYRGGGWFSYARRCRSAYRDGHAPGERESTLGFRLCRTLPE